MNLFACLSLHPFPSLSSVSYFCLLSRRLEVTIPLCLGLQLEQFNMIENAISSNSLYSPCSTLNYSQAAMMGLTGSHGSLQDSPQLSYSSHGNIPNIILTGEQTPRLAEPSCPGAAFVRGELGREPGVSALRDSVSPPVGAEFLAVGLLLQPCPQHSAACCSLTHPRELSSFLCPGLPARIISVFHTVENLVAVGHLETVSA